MKKARVSRRKGLYSEIALLCTSLYAWRARTHTNTNLYRNPKSILKNYGKKKNNKFEFSLFGSTYAESKLKAASFLFFSFLFYAQIDRSQPGEDRRYGQKSSSNDQTRCTAIEYLDLRYCHGITDYGLMLLRLLWSMKKLWILGCCLITERGLAKVRERTDIDLPPRPICAIRCPFLQV